MSSRQVAYLILFHVFYLSTNPQVAGVVIPTYSDVWGPTYTWDPATATRISSTPLLPDPWEATMVEVRQSSMEQVSTTN